MKPNRDPFEQALRFAATLFYMGGKWLDVSCVATVPPTARQRTVRYEACHHWHGWQEMEGKDWE